jgi:hypothetical protein
MDQPAPESSLLEEERIVAELEQLGIGYLSRQTPDRAQHVRAPETLLADLVQQPSARVRTAVIAVLLAHPEYAAAVPAALAKLQPAGRMDLRLYYTATMLLQQEYAHCLRSVVGPGWQRLPDLFSAEFGVPAEGPPRERLLHLGRVHHRLTGVAANWAGTYENAARHLIRRWELERQWNR